MGAESGLVGSERCSDLPIFITLCADRVTLPEIQVTSRQVDHQWEGFIALQLWYDSRSFRSAAAREPVGADARGYTTGFFFPFW